MRRQRHLPKSQPGRACDGMEAIRAVVSGNLNRGFHVNLHAPRQRVEYGEHCVRRSSKRQALSGRVAQLFDDFPGSAMFFENSTQSSIAEIFGMLRLGRRFHCGVHI